MNKLVSALSAQYRSKLPKGRRNCRRAAKRILLLTGADGFDKLFDVIIVSVLLKSRRPRCGGRTEHLFQLFNFVALVVIWVIWTE